MTFYKQIYISPLGEMSLVADETGLVGAWFFKQKYFERGLEKATMPVENDILKRTRLLLDSKGVRYSLGAGCWWRCGQKSLFYHRSLSSSSGKSRTINRLCWGIRQENVVAEA